MEFTTDTTPLHQIDTDCIVVPILQDQSLPAAAEQLDQVAEGRIGEIITSGDFPARAESTLMLHRVTGIQAPRILLFGCGKAGELNAARWRRIVTGAAGALDRSAATRAVVALDGISVQGMELHAMVRALAHAVLTAGYRFDEFKSAPETPEHPLSALVLATPDADDIEVARLAMHEARCMEAGASLARDLANRPGNVCTPTHLAEQARALAEQWPRIETRILDQDEMRELGMGALLAVSQGSRQPPRLIAMEYSGADSNTAPIVLVGKGVTFDTGGISIKPASGMDEMKFDMGGAASVFGAMRACAELEIPLNVVGVVPAVENMPDGNAVRPGDIVTSMSGKTIEVLNTDAEGRLILCDALTWIERYRPAAVIDIATLTGACITALGHHVAALLTPSEDMAQALLAAGDSSGDPCWRLPLWDVYQEQLRSPFADMANIGGPAAGTITAACFLSRFTGDYEHWAHLDIAGVAWTRGDRKGATGRPVSLLVQYLLDRGS